MHTPLWIKIGMALGFAYLAIFTINLVGDMIGGSGGGHGEETAHVAEAAHDTDVADTSHDTGLDTGHAEAPAMAHEDQATLQGDAAAVVEEVTAAVEETVAAVEETVAALVGDAIAGAKTSKKCISCHSFDDGGKHKVGPNLFNLFARGRGAAEGYKYSGALSSLGGSWSDTELDAFLAEPKAFAPGTKMNLKTRKEGDRANLIAFLKTLH